MQSTPTLHPGNTIEIIAPAARCSDQLLDELKKLFASFGLHCLVSDTIFGEDLLCANTDEMRFAHLKKALYHPTTKAVICARGGYGSMRLIPELAKLQRPEKAKLFVGMSDITALQLYLQQEWKWPCIHGAFALDKFSPESIASLKSVLFGEKKHVTFSELSPLNLLAQKNQTIQSTLTGGNLCLVQASIGTAWQMDARGKIIFLEEVNERAYRVDRMLEHLRQAHLFQNAVAIIFGDFLLGNDPDGISRIQPVLTRFAESCTIPVVQAKGIGHDYESFPLVFGTPAVLQCGNEMKLTYER